MAESQFERLQQQISFLEETNSQMAAFLNECYAQRETHPYTTLPQPLPSLKTTTLPSQKKTQPTIAEFQTQPQSPNLLAHLILSRPKIHTHTTPDLILEPPPTPCRDPYKTGHSRHNPPLRLQPLQPKSLAESVRSTHWPAHPTPRHTAIHKLIPIRQTTITLEFLSQPQPESPPSPPNDLKPTTTQEQTKESRTTVAQPDPPPTRRRDYYRADPAPLPCVAFINPPSDGCDTGHRTITPKILSLLLVICTINGSSGDQPNPFPNRSSDDLRR
jgi:hypothetical protein